jgi:hypothetical protein
MRLAVWTTLLAFTCYLAVQGVSGRRDKNAPKSLPPMVRNYFLKSILTSMHTVQTILAFKSLTRVRNSLQTLPLWMLCEMLHLHENYATKI